MATKNNTKEQYKSARNAFDDLKIEEKAVFLIESTVAMLVHGIEKVGKTVGDGLDEAFSKANNGCEKNEEAEEKETKSEAAPQKTTRKRTTTTRKKKTTRRTKPPEDKSE